MNDDKAAGPRTLYFKDRVYETAKRLADEDGRSVSNLFKRLIEDEARRREHANHQPTTGETQCGLT